jgi:hypothetical protein
MSPSSKNGSEAIASLSLRRNDCKKVPDEFERDRCYDMAMQDKDYPYVMSENEMKEFDKESQLRMSQSLESYRSNPAFVPYVPDPQFTDKAIALQIFYNATQIANMAEHCQIREWQKYRKLSSLFNAKLRQLFGYNRDDIVVLDHLTRVWHDTHRDYQVYYSPNPSYTDCDNLARSDDLRMVESIIKASH